MKDCSKNTSCLVSPVWTPLLSLVGLGRVELPTSPLSGVRSSQLSYRPDLFSQLIAYSSSRHAIKRSATLLYFGG